MKHRLPTADALDLACGWPGGTRILQRTYVTGPEGRWKVREYAEPDRPAIEACFRELQEFERTIDADRAQAETVVKPYIDWILEHCRERSGKIYVADDGIPIATEKFWSLSHRCRVMKLRAGVS